MKLDSSWSFMISFSSCSIWILDWFIYLVCTLCSVIYFHSSVFSVLCYFEFSFVIETGWESIKIACRQKLLPQSNAKRMTPVAFKLDHLQITNFTLLTGQIQHFPFPAYSEMDTPQCTPKVNSTKGWMTLGHSNWIICSPHNLFMQKWISRISHMRHFFVAACDCAFLAVSECGIFGRVHFPLRLFIVRWSKQKQPARRALSLSLPWMKVPEIGKAYLEEGCITAFIISPLQSYIKWAKMALVILFRNSNSFRWGCEQDYKLEQM